MERNGLTESMNNMIMLSRTTLKLLIILSYQLNKTVINLRLKLCPVNKKIVHDAVDTVIKFRNNDPNYKPMREILMGRGGTRKFFIINIIISIVRKLTSSNDIVQVAAPSGAAAFNVQGSTIHNLLGVRVSHPEKELNEQAKTRLLEQLKQLLVLIIDEHNMITSKVLATTEQNTCECIYRGQNSPKSGEVFLFYYFLKTAISSCHSTKIVQ